MIDIPDARESIIRCRRCPFKDGSFCTYQLRGTWLGLTARNASKSAPKPWTSLSMYTRLNRFRLSSSSSAAFGAMNDGKVRGGGEGDSVGSLGHSRGLGTIECIGARREGSGAADGASVERETDEPEDEASEVESESSESSLWLSPELEGVVAAAFVRVEAGSVEGPAWELCSSLESSEEDEADGLYEACRRLRFLAGLDLVRAGGVIATHAVGGNVSLRKHLVEWKFARINFSGGGGCGTRLALPDGYWGSRSFVAPLMPPSLLRLK